MWSWLEPVGEVLWRLRLPLVLYLAGVLFCWVLVELLRAIIMQIRSALKEARFKKSDLNSVDRMSDRDFVGFLAFLLDRAGFEVQFTPPGANYGVDLVLVHPGTEERIALHGRRSPQAVSVGPVREAQATRAFYECTRSIIVSNAAFEEAAQEAARFCSVTLVDRAKLQELMRQLLPFKAETADTGEPPEEPTGTEGARA